MIDYKLNDYDDQTPQSDPKDKEVERRLKPWVTFLICALIIVGTAAAIYTINTTEPTTRPEGATKQSAMLVETTTVNKGTYRAQIEALGRVTAANEVMLSPRVSGQIISLHPDFKPGSMVPEGTVLATIDKADFENALQQRQAELAQAMADLSQEKGRQNVAKQEYKMIGRELDDTQKALVLREPQLTAAKSAVLSANSAVKQAELDLQRTDITAPFNAQIITREINLGSQVSTNTPIAHLIGTDEYWVIATVPVIKLPWIEFGRTPDSGEPNAKIIEGETRKEQTIRHGYVEKLIASLDKNTRLARILITVPNPLDNKNDNAPLLVDGIVNTTIHGRQIENVVRIKRDYLRKNDTVWVMDNDGKLSVRETDIIFKDATYAYLRDGLNDGEKVVTSNLTTVADGAPLRENTEETDNK